MKPKTLVTLTLAAALLALVAACGGPPPDGTTVPATPTNVTATPGEGFVTVAWEHDGANATGFVVYREAVDATAAVLFVRAASPEAPLEQTLDDASARAPVRVLALESIATVGADERSYRDEDVDPDTRYRYAVAAKGAGGRESPSADQGGAPVGPGPAPDPDPVPVGENPDPTRYLALLLQDGAGNAVEGATVSIVLVRSEDASPRSGYTWNTDEGVALLVDRETQPWVEAGTYDALLTVRLGGGGATAALVAVLADVAVPGTITLATDDPRFVDLDVDLVGATGPRAYLSVAAQLGTWAVAGYPLEVSSAGGSIRVDPGAYEFFVNAQLSPTVVAMPSYDVAVSVSSTVTFDLAAEPAFTLAASFDPPSGVPEAHAMYVCPRAVRDGLYIAAWNCLPASSVLITPGTYAGSVNVRLQDGSTNWSYSFELAPQPYGPAGAATELVLGGPGGLTVETASDVYRRTERVTFDGGLFDAKGFSINYVWSNDGSGLTASEMRLRVTDPAGTLVHEVNGTASLLRRPWEHGFLLPSDAPGGTYAVEVTIDTGPYLGPLTASTAFLVDAPGDPPDLTATALWRTEGFTGSVRAVAWDAAHGRVIASGTGSVRAYDAVTGDEAWVVDQCGRGRCGWSDLGFLDDSIVAVSWSGLTVIDAATGDAVTVVEGWDLPSEIRAAALRPDGGALLTVGFSGEIDLWDTDLWDTDTWSVSRSYELDSQLPVSVAWSPDGSALALGTAEGQVLVLDADDGSVLTIFTRHAEAERSGSVAGIAWSPDGTLIASGGDERVRVWRADDGEELAELQLGEVARFASQVAWSSDGSRLAAVGADGALIIQGAVAVWDADGWAQSWSAMLDGPSGYAYAVAWSPDGTAVFTGDLLRRVTRWDAATGTPSWARQGDANEGRSVAWAPDGDRFVTGTREDNGVLVWNLAGDVVASLRADDGLERNFGRYVNAVDWSADGTRIVSAHFDGGVSLWDATTYEVIYTLDRRSPSAWHEDTVSAVHFSPDGAAFVTGSRDSTARIWRTSDGVFVRTLSGHTSEVYAVAWSPDGDLIATASTDGTARIWDADTGDELRVVDWGARAVYSVAFSPDGGTLATGGDWSAVRLWDPLTGKLLRELDTDDSMFSLSWTADGALLAGGSTLGPVTVWDAATGGWIVLDDVGRSSLGVAWSPAGQHLAIATWNPAVTLVEVTGAGAP